MLDTIILILLTVFFRFPIFQNTYKCKTYLVHAPTRSPQISTILHKHYYDVISVLQTEPLAQKHQICVICSSSTHFARVKTRPLITDQGAPTKAKTNDAICVGAKTFDAQL